jgi:hypothetical protein
MEKEFLKILLLPLMTILVAILLYFTLFYEYEYESKVGMKIYVEPKLMLDRYKARDLELTPAEFSSLSTTYSDVTYISEAEHYFMVDGYKIFVNNYLYNKYQEGDNIKYYKALLEESPKIKK